MQQPHEVLRLFYRARQQILDALAKGLVVEAGEAAATREVAPADGFARHELTGELTFTFTISPSPKHEHDQDVHAG